MHEPPPIPEHEREFWRIVYGNLNELRWEGDRIIAVHELEQWCPDGRGAAGRLSAHDATRVTTTG